MAKASNTASQRGAFFDSTIDRITDSLLLGCVGWYLASSEGSNWEKRDAADAAVSAPG